MSKSCQVWSTLFGLAIWATALPSMGAEPQKEIRVGIIGVDTSHAVKFTEALNDPKAPEDYAGVKIVAAFPGGSPDIPSSADRLDKHKEILKKLGVELVDSIDILLTKVDAVLLESVDGRPHLEQAKPVLAARKRMFIDKPCAGSLADVIEIFRLAKQYDTPIFSSSSLRFAPPTQEMLKDRKVVPVLGCAAWSPCSLEPHHPDLFWYGVHGVEILYTAMGTGCRSVTRVSTEDTDLVVGVWADGRVGTFRGTRKGPHDYGAVIFGAKSIAPTGKFTGYGPLISQICKFFRSGQPPVSAEETIELFAFMEAADESKRQGGVPVTLESVMAKARQGVAGK